MTKIVFLLTIRAMADKAILNPIKECQVECPVCRSGATLYPLPDRRHAQGWAQMVCGQCNIRIQLLRPIIPQGIVVRKPSPTSPGQETPKSKSPLITNKEITHAPESQSHSLPYLRTRK